MTADHSVDTKLPASGNFGNMRSASFVSASRNSRAGHRGWRAYRAWSGTLATESRSFDLVRAVADI
jgi:hypothetical protein